MRENKKEGNGRWRKGEREKRQNQKKLYVEEKYENRNVYEVEVGMREEKKIF